MIEGFANFYAAAVFNDSFTGSDCTFSQVGGRALDCEGNSSLPDRWMLTQCQQSSGGWARDRGNEWDWLKAFWDVHTDAAPRPSIDDILGWIRSAAEQGVPYSRSNYYALLNGRAETISSVASFGETGKKRDSRNNVNGTPMVLLQADNSLLVRVHSNLLGER